MRYCSSRQVKRRLALLAETASAKVIWSKVRRWRQAWLFRSGASSSASDTFAMPLKTHLQHARPRAISEDHAGPSDQRSLLRTSDTFAMPLKTHLQLCDLQAISVDFRWRSIVEPLMAASWRQSSGSTSSVGFPLAGTVLRDATGRSPRTSPTATTAPQTRCRAAALPSILCSRLLQPRRVRCRREHHFRPGRC